MQDQQTLRRLARRCGASVTGSTAPRVARQLRLWAVELADAADKTERATARQAQKGKMNTSPVTKSRRASRPNRSQR
jgi:hypothetical protein